jgi:hypothetical protein
MNGVASWIGLLLTGLVMVVSAVWAVASIRGSTRELGRSIDALRDWLERQDERICGVCAKHETLNTRVSRLEGRHASDDEQKR